MFCRCFFVKCENWLFSNAAVVLITKLHRPRRCTCAGASVVCHTEYIRIIILVGTLMFGEPLTTNIVVGIGFAIVAVTFMISVTKR